MPNMSSAYPKASTTRVHNPDLPLLCITAPWLLRAVVAMGRIWTLNRVELRPEPPMSPMAAIRHSARSSSMGQTVRRKRSSKSAPAFTASAEARLLWLGTRPTRRVSLVDRASHYVANGWKADTGSLVFSGRFLNFGASPRHCSANRR